MFGGVFLDQGQIALTLVIGAFCQLLVHLVDASLQLRDVGKGLLCLLTNRRIVLQDHHLWQIANPAISRHTHITSCRPLLSTEDLQHRRLTGTILTHQGNTVTGVDDETGISEQGVHSKLHLQSFY